MAHDPEVFLLAIIIIIIIIGGGGCSLFDIISKFRTVVMFNILFVMSMYVRDPSS
jgi:hypothetical protein